MTWDKKRDLDSGAGVDYRASVGLLTAGAGGVADVALPTALTAGGGLKVGVTDGTLTTVSTVTSVTTVGTITNVVHVDDNASTLSVDDGGGTLTVDGTVTIQDGGGAITVDGTVTVQDGGSTISVDDGGGAITVDGTVATTYTAFSHLSDFDADESVEDIKTSAGTLYGVDAYNPGAAGAWIQIFNAQKGAVNLGTTVPDLSLYLPPTSGRDPFWGPNGDAFSTAMSYAVTTTATGNGAPATHIQVTFRYI